MYSIFPNEKWGIASSQSIVRVAQIIKQSETSGGNFKRNVYSQISSILSDRIYISYHSFPIIGHGIRRKEKTKEKKKGGLDGDFGRILAIFIPCSLVPLAAGHADREILLNDTIRWV